MTDEQKRVILQAIAQARTTSHAWDAVNSILSTHAASAPNPSYTDFETWLKGPHARVQTMLDAFDAGKRLANPSDKQEAVALKDQIIGDLQSAFDSELITENDSGDELVRLSAAIACVEDAFAAPLAQSAEQDRIDAERYRKWVSYSGFTKEHCDATLDPIKINEHAAKGASK